MERFKRIGICCIIWLIPLKVFCQIDLDYYNGNDEESLLEILYNQDQKYPINKYNINIIGETILTEKLGISDTSASAIINHRKNYGDILSIYELQRISNLTHEEIIIIKNNCRFSRTENSSTTPYISAHKLKIDGLYSSKISGRFETKTGRNLSQRYKISSNSIEGINTKLKLEQDKGESFKFSKNQIGFDFIGGFIEFKKTYGQLIIGDFNVSFGQGLILWSSFSLPAGLNPEFAPKFKTSISGNGGFMESIFMRGIGYRYEKKGIKIIVWGSQNFEDKKSIINPDKPFDNLRSSGYHITPSEITNKDKLILNSTGILVEKKYRTLKFGGAYVQNQLKIIGNTNEYGKESYISAFGNYYTSQTTYFGEIAAETENLTPSFIIGALNSLSKYSTLSIIGRNFESDFKPTFGNPLKAKANGINEKALYLGYQNKFSPKAEFRFFIDFGVFSDGKHQNTSSFFKWSNKYSKWISKDFEVGSRIKYTSTTTKEIHTNKLNQAVEFSLFEKIKQENYKLFIQSTISQNLTNPIRSFSFAIRNQHKISKTITLESTITYFNSPSLSPTIYYFDGGSGFGGSIWRLSGEGFKGNVGTKLKSIKNLTLGIAYRFELNLDELEYAKANPFDSEIRVLISYKK